MRSKGSMKNNVECLILRLQSEDCEIHLVMPDQTAHRVDVLYGSCSTHSDCVDTAK